MHLATNGQRSFGELRHDAELPILLLVQHEILSLRCLDFDCTELR